jgi:hypothetical protein
LPEIKKEREKERKREREKKLQEKEEIAFNIKKYALELIKRQIITKTLLNLKIER